LNAEEITGELCEDEEMSYVNEYEEFRYFTVLVITLPFLKQVREIKSKLKVMRHIIKDDASSDNVESDCTALSNCMA
jgi:hypothetical protein